MIILQLLLLAIPTILKVVIDLYEIKKLKRPINHRSEIRLFLVLGFLLALLNMAFTNDFSLLVRFIQGAVMGSAIFFQFFDWIMGTALHGNPFYEGEAKTDKVFADLGPINTTFIRLWYSIVAIGTFFHMDLIL